MRPVFSASPGCAVTEQVVCPLAVRERVLEMHALPIGQVPVLILELSIYDGAGEGFSLRHYPIPWLLMDMFRILQPALRGGKACADVGPAISRGSDFWPIFRDGEGRRYTG